MYIYYFKTALKHTLLCKMTMAFAAACSIASYFKGKSMSFNHKTKKIKKRI
jgi:hypothetical protein